MIRLSVMYPAGEGAWFDHDYYRDVHMPMVQSLLGAERYEIDTGVQGPYVAAVHMIFDTMELFETAIFAARENDVLTADVVNYTNIESVSQLSHTS